MPHGLAQYRHCLRHLQHLAWLRPCFIACMDAGDASKRDFACNNTLWTLCHLYRLYCGSWHGLLAALNRRVVVPTLPYQAACWVSPICSHCCQTYALCTCTRQSRAQCLH